LAQGEHPLRFRSPPPRSGAEVSRHPSPCPDRSGASARMPSAPWGAARAGDRSHQSAHRHHAHQQHGPQHRNGSAVAEGSSSDAQGDSASKGAISLLQEFVQCSKQFHAPQHRPILQWAFDTRMTDFTTLEFRATVAFVLDGVAHHVAGAWHLSKKFAQRDAAERALGFFVGVWGEALLAELDQAGQKCPPPSNFNRVGHVQKEMRVLEDYCKEAPSCAGSRPRWTLRWEGDRCIAVVEVRLLGVMHKLTGTDCSSAEAAYADTARRVLWYLRCPGFDDLYEANPTAPALAAREIPAPPANWATGDTAEEDALNIAERKTALMRVQNRLQQAYARQLRPGQSVWEWSYETDSNDSGWPPLCRASVNIPVIGRSFTGDWTRGQRDAQISASAEVAAFLDQGVGAGPSPQSEGPQERDDAASAETAAAAGGA